MSKRKYHTHVCLWSGGLAGSLTGLLLLVSSMECGTITAGKLLLVLLCLVGAAVCVYPLRYCPASRRSAAPTALRTIRKHMDTHGRAA